MRILQCGHFDSENCYKCCVSSKTKTISDLFTIMVFLPFFFSVANQLKQEAKEKKSAKSK